MKLHLKRVRAGDALLAAALTPLLALALATPRTAHAQHATHAHAPRARAAATPAPVAARTAPHRSTPATPAAHATTPTTSTTPAARAATPAATAAHPGAPAPHIAPPAARPATAPPAAHATTTAAPPTPRTANAPPAARAATTAPAAPVLRPGVAERLDVAGTPGAWFFRPDNPRGRQRVFVYLHARNADPVEHCRRWHESVRSLGWLLCPIGQVDRGEGRREWHNNRDFAHRATIAALDALGARFPRRVQRHDNVIMGFSEGAYVGMNVALMAPRTFPRWLIIAADDRYIAGEDERMHRARFSLHRLYLLTGEHDAVLERTRRAQTRLERAFGRARVQMHTLDGAGHELPPAMVPTTRDIFRWLTH